jgi:hypothetical protein
MLKLKCNKETADWTMFRKLEILLRSHPHEVLCFINTDHLKYQHMLNFFIELPQRVVL